MSYEKGKTFPVAGTSMTIPWSIAEEAYLGYNPRGVYSQTLERLAERGGFHVSELDEYVPDWREKAGEITQLRADLRAARVEAKQLRAEALRCVDEVCEAMVKKGAAQLVEGKSKVRWHGVGVAIVTRDLQNQLRAAFTTPDGLGEEADDGS